MNSPKALFRMTLIFSFLFFIGKAYAENYFDYEDFERKGMSAFNGAMGFTLGPDTFLISPGADFFLSNDFALGPQVQFGVSDSRLLLTGEANFKFQMDIQRDDFWKRVKPFIQFGAGLALVNRKIPAASSDTEISALVNMGWGFYIFINNKTALGNSMLFNILTPPSDERFIFSWHFLTFKYFF